MNAKECIKWLWKASDGVRGRVVASTAAGVMHTCASLGFVYMCKRLIDAVTLHTGDDVAIMAAVMIGCMILQILSTALEIRISNHTDIILKNRLRHALFTDLMESRWDGMEKFHSGDALNRVMEDVRVVAEALTRSVPALIIAGVQFVAAAAFLFMLEPVLAWLVPGLLLVMLVISKSYVRRMRRLTRDIRDTESSMQALMQESLQHRIIIHTFEQTPMISDSLSGRQEELREQVMDKTGYTIFARTFVQAGFAAGYASAFLWGVYGIMRGTATFGMMTAFLQLVGQVQRPIMNLSRQLPALINSLTSAERLAEMSAMPKEEKGTPVMLGCPVGIRVENLRYSYPDSTVMIFDGFSHDFEPGSVTALVGETGVGKSTLMRLVLGLVEPHDGSICLYGSQGSSKACHDTRCNIVYVPQGNTLMSGTIRENLLLGNPAASDAMLDDVLHLAAADFVKSLPDGLDTRCGEKGSGLSEGQAQRIAIARALLREGGILLLDEPTASLDPETERVLLSRLTSHADGRTILIITHREAALEMCTSIVRLDR